MFFTPHNNCINYCGLKKCLLLFYRLNWSSHNILLFVFAREDVTLPALSPEQCHRCGRRDRYVCNARAYHTHTHLRADTHKHTRYYLTTLNTTFSFPHKNNITHTHTHIHRLHCTHSLRTIFARGHQHPLRPSHLPAAAPRITSPSALRRAPYFFPIEKSHHAAVRHRQLLSAVRTVEVFFDSPFFFFSLTDGPSNVITVDNLIKKRRCNSDIDAAMAGKWFFCFFYLSLAFLFFYYSTAAHKPLFSFPAITTAAASPRRPRPVNARTRPDTPSFSLSCKRSVHRAIPSRAPFNCY